MTSLQTPERRHRPLQAKGVSFEPSWNLEMSQGTTRSNTPDSNSYEQHSNDNQSDKDSYNEIDSWTPKTT
jgi:hypothetical protein